MARLPKLDSVPEAYAVVAGGCDRPLPSAVSLSNNDVIALRSLRQFRYVPYVACVALDANPALDWSAVTRTTSNFCDLS